MVFKINMMQDNAVVKANRNSFPPSLLVSIPNITMWEKTAPVITINAPIAPILVVLGYKMRAERMSSKIPVKILPKGSA